MQNSVSENTAIITVQDTIEDVIADVKSKSVQTESIWIARRFSDNEDHQEFYKVQVSLENGKLQFDSSDIQFIPRGNHRYAIVIKNDLYEVEALQYRFDTSDGAVTALTVTQNGSMLIVGTSSGDIVIYDAETRQKVRRIAGAHFAGISRLLMMPSDQALLSVGRDFQIRLWLLENGSETTTAVRTFLGQKAQISDVATIGKGRNFLSLSLDGLVNLWECGSGKVVLSFRRIDNLEDPCTCIAVSTVGDLPGQKDDPLLFECGDKVVYVGYESGLIQQFSVGGHYQTGVKLRPSSDTFRSGENVSVSSIVILGNCVAAGYSNGTLVVFDVEKGQEHLLELNKNYPVENLCVEKCDENESVVVASNGPDMLLRIHFESETGSFRYRYLVGLPELFQVELIAHNSKGTVVASNDQIAVYK